MPWKCSRKNTMAHLCETKGCGYPARDSERLCPTCKRAEREPSPTLALKVIEAEPRSLAQLYPKYHKDVSRLSTVDVYAIHLLFDITDPSGCIQHSSKKLLLSGSRTGGKSKYQDIKEARDTLNRWLELNPESSS